MKKEPIEYVVRYFVAVVVLIMLGSILWGDRSDCGIDAVTLACRWKGSVADVIGLILVLAACASLAGLAERFHAYGKKSSGMKNHIITALLFVVGMALIWNA